MQILTTGVWSGVCVPVQSVDIFATLHNLKGLFKGYDLVLQLRLGPDKFRKLSKVRGRLTFCLFFVCQTTSGHICCLRDKQQIRCPHWLFGRQPLSQESKSSEVDLVVCAPDSDELKLTLYITWLWYIQNYKFFTIGVLLMASVLIKHYGFFLWHKPWRWLDSTCV